METRGRAAFSTGLRGKTAIWPGDVVQHDIKGIYIWRPGDTALEKPRGDKYLIRIPAILSAHEIDVIAQDFATTIGLMMGLSVTATTIESGIRGYRLEEKK